MKKAFDSITQQLGQLTEEETAKLIREIWELLPGEAQDTFLDDIAKEEEPDDDDASGDGGGQ